jgi:hypothetical protein
MSAAGAQVASILVVADAVTEPIRFPGAPPAWIVVVLLAIVVALVRWIYRRERQKVSRPWRILLGGMRIVAIALVVIALFRPEREVSEIAYDKSHLVVLLDTSSSMATKDRYGDDAQAHILAAAYPDDGPDARPGVLDLSRAQIAQRTLAGSGEALLAELAERFVLHVYTFDDELRLLAETESRSSETGETATPGSPVHGADAAAIARAIRAAKAEGTQTAIGPALKEIAREFVGRDDRRLAGVILITDGHDNAAAVRPLEALATLGKGAEDLRVSAVALGDPLLAKNLWVDRVIAKDEVLRGDTATFVAELRQKGFDPGFDGVAVSLEISQIADENLKPLGKPLPYPTSGEDAQKMDRRTATVRLLPTSSPKPTTASLRALFTRAGEFAVKVKATLPGSHAKEDAIAEDNEKVVHVVVRDSTIKVLLVDREMRYETHFLKNVLVRESRHAGDPRRVDTQVWIQSFDPDVRQPSGGEFKLTPLRAFPSTRAEIFAYDVIILGDVAWRQLGPTDEKSREILGIIRDFVAEGGGVAFVAGESADPTQYLETPLEELVPLVMSPADRSNELSKTVPFRLAPTADGRIHPILSVLQEQPEKVDEIWREHDGWEWYWLYRSKGGLKPNATALARVGNQTGSEFLDDRRQPYVVFADAGFGKGRVFFSAIDQISRIRMSFADVYYGAFWDETIRWLATYKLKGGNRRYKIETDKETYFVGESAAIKVWALDSDFQPLRDPVLRGMQVEGPDGKPLLSEADAPKHSEGDDPGLYKTYLRLVTKGSYRVYVDPPERDGGARAEHPFEVRYATKEDQDKVPDHELLKLIVEKTNPPSQPGRLWAPWQMSDLVRSIPPFSTPQKINPHDEPLWDNAWLLVLVTAILAVEWILRKRFQMI